MKFLSTRSRIASKFITLVTVSIMLFVQIAMADHKQTPYEKLARWAGCTAQVETSDNHSAADSHYQYYPDKVLRIGTDQTIPDPIEFFILMHELSHCLQDQEGVLHELGHPGVELDADRRAAELLCALGQDGRRLGHDTFVWFKETFDYDGDPSHGTLAQRINASLGAGNYCIVTPQQAG